MIKLSFRQTNAEMMVRIASSLVFETLTKSGCPSVSLSELAEESQYGFTASAVSEEVGPKLVRITDLKDGGINWNTVPYCQCEKPEKYLLHPDDILFARTGATTGKTFLVHQVPYAVFASYLIRIRPKERVYSQYLVSFFQSDSYWFQIVDEKEGSAQPNVNGRKLMTIQIPEPDKEIQSAIGKFVGAVRARQDGSVKDLPPLPAPLSQIPDILARVDALAQRVEEARGLRRAAVEQAKSVIQSALHENFQAPQPQITLGEAIQLHRGYDLTVQQMIPGKYPVMGSNGEIGRHVEFRSKGPGVVTGRSGSVGAVNYIAEDFWPHNTSLYVSDFKGNDPRLIYYLLLSVSEEIKRIASHTAVATLDRKKAHIQIMAYVPPLADQRRIVAYLDGLQAKVDELRQLQAATQKELDALMPSILAKAFAGEL